MNNKKQILAEEKYVILKLNIYELKQYDTVLFLSFAFFSGNISAWIGMVYHVRRIRPAYGYFYMYCSVKLDIQKRIDHGLLLIYFI